MNKNTFKEAIHFLFFSLFVVFVIVSFLYRSNIINIQFGHVIGCENCLTSSLAIHDGIFLSIVLLLLIGSFIFSKLYVHVLLRACAILLMAGYLIDIAILLKFSSRLNIADVRIYGGQLGPLIEHIKNTETPGISWPLTIFLTTLSVIMLVVKPIKFRVVYAYALLIPFTLIINSTLNSAIPYVHNWALINYIEYNLPSGVSVQYSKDLIAETAAQHAPEEITTCTSNTLEKNIILLILESWSPYQSNFFSGINNWTPKLDLLAEKNTAFTNMYAGGFTTNEGLMALFTGRDYLSPTKSLFQITQFETAWGLKKTVPLLLRSKAIHTAFLTNGNLEFSKKGEWLNEIGFDYYEGHEHSGYKGLPRAHFNAAADEHLYNRAASYIKERNSQYFMAVENTSTHQPFIHPITKEKSKEAVFRYMDETVNDFYLTLKKEDFFKDGILIMVSDHRSMTPISKKELALFGDSAASKIPMIIIDGNEEHKRIDTIFHQADLLSTVDQCNTTLTRSFLQSESSEERCVFHARGDDRDIINVFCPNGHGSVQLNGDNSYFLNSTNLPIKQQAVLINKINADRIMASYQTNPNLHKG